MSLTIEKFVTLYRGGRQESAQPLIDQIVRENFAAECSRQISVRWTAQPSVIRIRRLDLRLRLNRVQPDDGRLVRAWVELLVKGLFTALASPEGAGSVEVVRAGSRAEWLARFIRDLISGQAHQRWEYEEFRPLLEMSTSAALINLLCDEPSEIVPVLLELERSRSLDRLVALLDELALERLFVAVARAQGATQPDITIEDLLLVARLVVSRQMLLGDGKLAHQRQSLHIFLALVEMNAGSPWLTPRRVSHTLAALKALLELTHSQELSDWASTARVEQISESLGRTPSRPVTDLLARVHLMLSQQRDAKGINHHLLIQMSLALEALRPLSPSTATQVRRDKSLWVTSDCAGVFLVTGLLIRLGWHERFFHSAQSSTEGPRVLTYSLASLGLALLGKLEEPPSRFDPGLALFAGWVNDPDLAGLRRFLDGGSVADRLELLTSLARGDQALEKHAESWQTTFDWLARQLVGEFSRRVRGFRQASRDFVAKSFFAIAGRIHVDETRIIVHLAPSPFHVALHISSADEPVESLSWLDGRRLEFRLEGL
jgi:hypothetical protein